ncbi:MAG: hypothetical protein ACI3VR_07280 [Intestinibacter sp.]|uniref:hypothetical protein n=1 Tax=Intestinibacter sp. TaxID=1965304 RepID=UPI003F17EBF5
MTRAEFRGSFIAILGKADVINESISFIEVSASMGTLKGYDGKSFDTMTVRVKQYEKDIAYFDISSGFEEQTNQIKDILALLNELIDGIKEVI